MLKYHTIKSKNNFGKLFRIHYKSEYNHIKHNLESLENYVQPIKGTKTYIRRRIVSHIKQKYIKLIYYFLFKLMSIILN